MVTRLGNAPPAELLVHFSGYIGPVTMFVIY